MERNIEPERGPRALRHRGGRRSSSGRTLFNLANIGLTRGLEFFYALFIIFIIGRYLGPEEFGTYIFIWTIAFAVRNMMEAGISRIIVREIAVNKEQASKSLSSALAVNVLSGVLAGLVCYGVAVVSKLSSAEEILALYVALCSQIAFSMMRTVTQAFIAYERTFFNLVTIGSNRLLVILLCVSVMASGLGYVYLFTALLMGNTLGFLLSITIFHRKFAALHVGVNWANIRFIVSEALPLAVASVLVQLGINVNVLFLKLWCDISEVSFYTVPFRMTNAIVTIPTAVLIAILPLLSKSIANDAKDEALDLYCRIVKYTLLLSLPLSLIVTELSSDVVSLGLGQDFLGAVEPLELIVWITAPVLMMSLSELLLTALNKQKTLIIINGIFLISCLAAGILLVPQGGAKGAAIALLLSVTVQLVASVAFVGREIGYAPVVKAMGKPLSALIPAVLVLSFSNQSLNEYIVLAAGLAVYLFFVRILKVTDSVEKAQLRKLIRKVRGAPSVSRHVPL